MMTFGVNPVRLPQSINLRQHKNGYNPEDFTNIELNMVVANPQHIPQLLADHAKTGNIA